MGAMGDQPRGTVTFLFTDIAGSTELVRKLGQRYADTLAEHRQLLRAAFAEHEGWEIDTQGDAFFVAFDRVRDAVLTAADIQRSLAAEPSPAELSPRVRVGLHTAEPHIWSEGYVGMGVHRASRICAIGHGGQVLVSRSTAGLAADEELEGVSLLDLGEHRLKSLESPERIFQLVIDGLENDFPPLDTIEGAGLATETVTVLMTDLEGLTQRVRTLSPEQFRVLVAEYHRTLRRVLSESGGMGVASFFDTAIAVYRSARQAAIAAAKLQLTVNQHAWPSDERIRIGVALDSGEVVATGYGYFGPAVSRCGKLLQWANGGHVLVSEPTKNLLEGEDLGELELHDSKHFFPLESSEPRILRPGRPWRTTMPIYELIGPPDLIPPPPYALWKKARRRQRPPQ
jgi:class 3 adenylate cyclase